MPYRINGTGTIISPMPTEGGISIAMKWFTIAFIPLIPLGWQLIQVTQNDILLFVVDIVVDIIWVQIWEQKRAPKCPRFSNLYALGPNNTAYFI